MNNQPQYSLRARSKSFQYAYEGLVSLFKTQPNAWIHLFFTVLVVVLGFILKVNHGEGATLALAIGFVWVTEILNTAVEAMMDHVSPGKHPAVKYIKDIAAAAVLISAIAAVVVGIFIFSPKLF